MKLLDLRASDGSRQFGALPETVTATARDLHRLRAHLSLLRGATLVEVASDHVTEAWIDFEYEAHRFTMNNQFGEWWFFVADPAAPSDILHAVLVHFASVLTP